MQSTEPARQDVLQQGIAAGSLVGGLGLGTLFRLTQAEQQELR